MKISGSVAHTGLPPDSIPQIWCAPAGASGSINGEIQTEYDACIKVRAMLDPINDMEFFIV
jgi:hypothetical protein